MSSKRRIHIIAVFILACISLGYWISSSAIASAANDKGVELFYHITLADSSGPVSVELLIKNIHQPSLDLFVISLQDSQGGGYFKLISGVTARDLDGNELGISEVNASQALSSFDVTDPYTMVDRWHVTCQGETNIVISYLLPAMSEITPHLNGSNGSLKGVYYGVYDYILLRPSRASSPITKATIQHTLPANWSVATTYQETSPGSYDAKALATMYGDNSQRFMDFAETLFVWADTSKVNIDYQPADGLEFVFVGNARDLTPEIQAAYVQLYKYFSSTIGSLPIDRRMEINLDIPIFPSPYYQDHAIYAEWYSMYPGDSEYSAWKWLPIHTVSEGQEFVLILRPTMYTGVHRFARIWIGDLLPRELFTDSIVLVNEGLINYYENRAMGEFWKPSQVHQRFADMYKYYIENWLGSNDDRPVSQRTSGRFQHSFEDYKATLIIYLLNQKIIEASSGVHNIDDVSRLFYKRFAWFGEGELYYYTLEDFLQTIDDVVIDDFTPFYDNYVYGNDPLPLGTYFEDPDQDGLMTGQENELGTDPLNPDTDEDGYTDGEEVDLMRTNPNLPDTPTPQPLSTPFLFSTHDTTALPTSTITETFVPAASPLLIRTNWADISVERAAVFILVTIIAVGIIIELTIYRKKK